MLLLVQNLLSAPFEEVREHGLQDRDAGSMCGLAFKPREGAYREGLHREGLRMRRERQGGMYGRD